MTVRNTSEDNTCICSILHQSKLQRTGFYFCKLVMKFRRGSRKIVQELNQLMTFFPSWIITDSECIIGFQCLEDTFYLLENALI